MLPFFASVVRPPLGQPPPYLIHQTQTLLRLVSHHQRQHLLQQQQNQFEMTNLKVPFLQKSNFIPIKTESGFIHTVKQTQ